MSHQSARSASDAWNNADAYEAYVGRWSRLVAIAFLEWLAIPARKRWLDVGCGTGMLSRTILDQAAPQSVTGVDASEQYAAAARYRIASPIADFLVGDARALPVANQSFDAVVSGLMLNFVPEPGQETALREMTRATVSGGTIAAYVWDYAGGMEFMRAFWDAATALDPAAGNLDGAQRFPICHPENLAALWESTGLDDIETRAINIPTVFRDFDDFWLPFLGGQGSAPGYLKSLSRAQQIALGELLRKTLPAKSDGSIRLTARAWAVRGRREDHTLA
jgi:SAM-dependent methyltransferase